MIKSALVEYEESLDYLNAWLAETPINSIQSVNFLPNNKLLILYT